MDVSSESELTVRTQRWTTDGDRVDLELLFGRSSRPSVRVWIEAKIDALPERPQIERYLAALPPVPVDSFVCWLLPIGVEVRGGISDAAPIRTWAELATELFKWHQVQTELTYAVGLVSEFVRHLEECKLASIQPLDTADAAAMSRYRTTLARVAELVRLASERIASTRGEASAQGTWPTEADFWQTLPRGTAWPADVNFEWYGRIDDAREEPHGYWVIGAGASWQLGGEPNEADHREWYSDLHTRGFELGSGPHATYMFRYLQLDELAGGDTLSNQARSLADWVLETWDLLDQLPPRADEVKINPDHLVNDVVDEHGTPFPLGRVIEESDYP